MPEVQEPILEPTEKDIERFWGKVKKTDSCWEWHGTKMNQGYGTIGVSGRSGKKDILAHRFAYELLVGSIPVGLVIDHLCRNRTCVNPEHMEIVTHRVNLLRGIGVPAQNALRTHCPQGHPYDLFNTYMTPSNGHRLCRACQPMYRQRRRDRQKAAGIRVT